MSHADLSQYCLNLADAAKEASSWAVDNDSQVRSEQENLQKELRRSGRVLRQCARAAKRKMCVGVFGPSQAGKSYLISALARNASGGLIALFDKDKKDFIEEINPEGGKESTGLVTRFTMTRPDSLPEGFPVQIKLLTETDLVKIIANTYYADCEHKDMADIKSIMAEFEVLEKQGGTRCAHITIDSIEDLQEYIVKDFGAKPRVQELERCGYWKRAVDLAPKLNLENRVALYGILWDGIAQFTDLLRALLQALEKLGHAPEAFCPLDALIPRGSSIIDVAMLQGLGEDSSGKELRIRTAATAPVSLPLAVVTALTAELTIVMKEQPDDYFEHTDMLDFPGYRSRYKFSDVRRELEKSGMLKEMFLRGKVAYLFQRYCAEWELTGMLLCIGPSNQEVQDLPGVINDWILSTHGELPESRRGKPKALYFILTKCDMEFEQKKGAPSVETRWDNRLHASLLDFFGKQHDWPRIWDGTESFNNLFLLRNPNFRFDAVMEYDEQAREKGVRSDKEKDVAALKSSFLNSELVASHFKNPSESWAALMQENDGGISHIRNCLRPVCNPDIKCGQIETILAELSRRVGLRLKNFYKTDDKEEERRQKEAFSRTLAQIFARMIQNHNMGEFLHRLMVRDYDLYDLYYEARRRVLESSEEQAAASQNGGQVDTTLYASPETDDIMGDLFGDYAPAEAADSKSKPAANKTLPRDEIQYFAELIEGHWCTRLQAIAENPSIQARYIFPPKEVAKFVSELIHGAARLNLRGEIERELREAAAYANTARERIVWRQVGMASALLNHYIDWLGRSPKTKSPEERTVFMGGKNSVVFTPPVRPEAFPKLPDLPAGAEKNWCIDWIRAMHALLLENVDFADGQVYDREQNTRLGNIIKQFDAANVP